MSFTDATRRRGVCVGIGDGGDGRGGEETGVDGGRWEEMGGDEAF